MNYLRWFQALGPEGVEKTAASVSDLARAAQSIGIEIAPHTDWRNIGKLVLKGKVKSIEDIAGPSKRFLRAAEATPNKEVAEVWNRSGGARHLLKGNEKSVPFGGTAYALKGVTASHPSMVAEAAPGEAFAGVRKEIRQAFPSAHSGAVIAPTPSKLRASLLQKRKPFGKALSTSIKVPSLRNYDVRTRSPGSAGMRMGVEQAGVHRNLSSANLGRGTVHSHPSSAGTSEMLKNDRARVTQRLSPHTTGYSAITRSMKGSTPLDVSPSVSVGSASGLPTGGDVTTFTANPGWHGIYGNASKRTGHYKLRGKPRFVTSNPNFDPAKANTFQTVKGPVTLPQRPVRPRPVIKQSFYEELEKIASWQRALLEKHAAARWSKELRKVVDPAKAKKMFARMYRGEGVRPPMRGSDYVAPDVKEHLIKSLRGLGKVEAPDLTPRGGALWREAMKDIKHGRTSKFETGTSLKAAKDIVHMGPSGPIGRPLESNMPAIARARRVASRATPDSKWDAVHQKADSGMYAADAGTQRTRDYAGRAAAGRDPGAVVQFDLPRSLATHGSKEELRVSRQVFNRWSRNRKIISPGEHLEQSRLKKHAEANGHWRKLPPGHEGHDQGGNPQVGKTWVRRNRLKEFFKPFDHQKDFNTALQKSPRGSSIAAWGTGTGKTLASINAFEQLKGEGKANVALVIVPAGLRNNYAGAVGKFTGSKAAIVKKPTDPVPPEAEYIVLSYAAFRRDPQGFIDAFKPDVMIADELQRASNPNGQTYKSLALARPQVRYFMGLTASIAQNEPAEMAPLLGIAGHDPGNKKQFRKRYQKRDPKTNERRLQRKEELAQKVGPVIHYIEDLDASKKPVRDMKYVKVPMSDAQIKLYKMSMKGIDPKIVAKIEKGEPVSQKQAMHVFTRLLRARQVSNSMHTSMSPGMTLAQAAEQTPKIKAVLDQATQHVTEVSDGKVVIYTNIVKGGLDVLRAGLDARGVSYGVFAGRGVKGMTEENRNQAVKDYNSGKSRVLLITGAGAEGLDLPDTTLVQIVDGHYNPERIRQAEARGIRAGGLSHRPQAQRKVEVRRYVSTLPKTFWQSLTFRKPTKSVEQWVYSTAGRKQRENRELRDVLQARSIEEKKRRDSTMYRLTHRD
jgi:superfamily II DNA or RNA helicase